jgi:hypothetical protein
MGVRGLGMGEFASSLKFAHASLGKLRYSRRTVPDLQKTRRAYAVPDSQRRSWEKASNKRGVAWVTLTTSRTLN